MNTNQNQLVDAGLLPAIPPSLCAAVSRTNKLGGFLGKRQSFIQDCPAGDLNRKLKAEFPKLTAKARSAKVQDILRGAESLAWTLASLRDVALRNAGYQPIYEDGNKTGTAVSRKYVKVAAKVEPKAAVPTVSMNNPEVKALVDAAVAAAMAKMAAK